MDSLQVLVRGGGDLASGVILRLARVGLRTLVTELEQPLAVRRKVSFAQAVYDEDIEVEGVRASLVTGFAEIPGLWNEGIVPVIIDPNVRICQSMTPAVLVDGRMRKLPPEMPYPAPWMTIGLGPGFIAGQNCDAAVETQRGHCLGRVYWSGATLADTGLPDAVTNHAIERVLRAPQAGSFQAVASIGDIVQPGDPLARVGQEWILAPFHGVVRGLLMDDLQVTKGMKIGDLDPRADPSLCSLVSDKALAVGGGVLEAILSKPHLREALWSRRSA